MDRIVFQRLVLWCISAAIMIPGRLAVGQALPWSVSARDPVVAGGRGPGPARAVARETIGRHYASLLLLFYQNVLSVVVHSRCRMLPTCSNYGIAAVRKHGPLLGIMMTVDRLVREGHEQKEVPVEIIAGRARFRDPVEANDFWWCGAPETLP